MALRGIVDSLPLRFAPAGNDKGEPFRVIPGARSAGRGSMVRLDALDPLPLHYAPAGDDNRGKTRPHGSSSPVRGKSCAFCRGRRSSFPQRNGRSADRNDEEIVPCLFLTIVLALAISLRIRSPRDAPEASVVAAEADPAALVSQTGGRREDERRRVADEPDRAGSAGGLSASPVPASSPGPRDEAP